MDSNSEVGIILSDMPDNVRYAINHGDVAIITIVGDSMMPTIKHGGMAMIDRSCTEIVNDYAYVFEKEGLYDGYDGKSFCKRLRVEGGKLFIVSENANYDVITFDSPEHIKVIGKVIAFKGKEEIWNEVTDQYHAQHFIPIFSHEQATQHLKKIRT